MPNGLEQHFKQLLKEWRKSQQKKHGERVEARTAANVCSPACLKPGIGCQCE